MNLKDLKKIKIPKGWIFKYYQVEDGITKFVYEDNLGKEHIYINQEIEQDIPTYEELQERINKAIEIYDNCCKTQDFSTCDLEMYEILKGVHENGKN